MARQGAIGVEELIRRKVCSLRQWKMTRFGNQQANGRRFEFTLMTYNILSQTAIENHRYLYRKCDSRFLDEDYRISQILPEILNSQSDVICLQEVEERLFEEKIRGKFHSNGFEGLFKKRTCKDDGCAILWRTQKFSLIDHENVEFAKKDHEILNRDNIGLIAVLKPKHPDTTRIKLHVATTHLLFNPRRGDIKLSQLRLLLAQLEKMALKKVGSDGQRTYHPVILCGDFNIAPHSPLYEFIDTGRLDVHNRMSGDLSGQSEGKNKGRRVTTWQLSLKSVGIDDAGRLESVNESSDSLSASKKLCTSNKQNISSKPSPSSPCSSEVTDGAQSGNNSNCVNLDPNWLASVKNPAWIAAFQSLNGVQAAKDSESVDFVSPSPCFYHDFHFVPAYKYHTDKEELPVTCMTGRDVNNVDHIFYNVTEKFSPRAYKEGRLKLLGVYSLMHEKDLLDIGGLPNASLGSDHIFLMAKFAISGYYQSEKTH
ncbi:protein angel homolog 2-like isoform X2 [Uloborus diversus]|nr:protein angel homolog 2-like isoform X2 [Uloborus diversus]